MAHRTEASKRTFDIQIDENVDFSALMLSKKVLNGLQKYGFKRPSPVQLKAIPLGKCGIDLIVQAKSGTGKTCVFTVITLEMLSESTKGVQALILAPTREIAVQVQEVITMIGCCIKGLKCHAFIGGTALEQDIKKLESCQIAVGTPGRIKSLIENKDLNTKAIRLFVLDEADKLLEPGSFQEQINWIYSTLPKNKQVLALSATYPEYLSDHLSNYMNEPLHIRIKNETPTLIGIEQYYHIVPRRHLSHIVFESKAEKLALFLSQISFQQCLVFSNYHARAEYLAEKLSKRGWPVAYIAGKQTQEVRLNAMKRLKDFHCRILISTDLTSRGIDCDKVDLVINLDLPWDTETYLHRIGRAGRFGNYGMALSFVTPGAEIKKLQGIAKEIKYNIKPLKGFELGSDVSSEEEDEFLDKSDERSTIDSEGLLHGENIPNNCNSNDGENARPMNFAGFQANETNASMSRGEIKDHKTGKSENNASDVNENNVSLSCDNADGDNSASAANENVSLMNESTLSMSRDSSNVSPANNCGLPVDERTVSKPRDDVEVVRDRNLYSENNDLSMNEETVQLSRGDDNVHDSNLGLLNEDLDAAFAANRNFPTDNQGLPSVDDIKSLLEISMSNQLTNLDSQSILSEETVSKTRSFISEEDNLCSVNINKQIALNDDHTKELLTCQGGSNDTHIEKTEDDLNILSSRTNEDFLRVAEFTNANENSSVTEISSNGIANSANKNSSDKFEYDNSEELSEAKPVISSSKLRNMLGGLINWDLVDSSVKIIEEHYESQSCRKRQDLMKTKVKGLDSKKSLIFPQEDVVQRIVNEEDNASNEDCGRIEEHVGRVEDIVRKAEDAGRRIDQDVGRAEQGDGRVEQVVGRVEQVVGRVEEDVGSFEEDVVSFEEYVGRVKQVARRVEDARSVEEDDGTLAEYVARGELVEQRTEEDVERVVSVKNAFVLEDHENSCVQRSFEDEKLSIEEMKSFFPCEDHVDMKIGKDEETHSIARGNSVSLMNTRNFAVEDASIVSTDEEHSEEKKKISFAYEEHLLNSKICVDREGDSKVSTVSIMNEEILAKEDVKNTFFNEEYLDEDCKRDGIECSLSRKAHRDILGTEEDGSTVRSSEDTFLNEEDGMREHEKLTWVNQENNHLKIKSLENQVKVKHFVDEKDRMKNPSIFYKYANEDTNSRLTNLEEHSGARRKVFRFTHRDYFDGDNKFVETKKNHSENVKLANNAINRNSGFSFEQNGVKESNKKRRRPRKPSGNFVGRERRSEQYNLKSKKAANLRPEKSSQKTETFESTNERKIYPNNIRKTAAEKAKDERKATFCNCSNQNTQNTGIKSHDRFLRSLYNAYTEQLNWIRFHSSYRHYIQRKTFLS